MSLTQLLSLTLLVSLLSTTAFAHHTDQAKKWFDENQNSDLLVVQTTEVATHTQNEIKRMNEASFIMLNHFEPRQSATRINSISLDFAQKTFTSINENPVVSEYFINKYKNGSQIGFCFGRATYVHLVLIRAGVNKDSIKKIWAVGPMKTGHTPWQFHVATVVKSNDGGWYVIDTFYGSITTPEQWFQRMQGIATDSSLRFYVSDAEKFSVSLGKYNRVQLGLDLSADQDWYTHYFKDLMNWIANEPLESVGLYDLRKPRPAAPGK